METVLHAMMDMEMLQLLEKLSMANVHYITAKMSLLTKTAKFS